jgi:kynureninase
MNDPLLAYRKRFPILERTNYLISNSLGAVPVGVEDSLRSYYDAWATRGVRAWEEGWWMLSAELGDLVAPLIGAAAGTIVFQPNVTLSHAVVLSAIDFAGSGPHARRKIVTDAMHFPSILYLIDGLRARGATIEIVPSEDGIGVDTGRLLSAIDEQTAAVCISHILFKSAYIHDVKAITEKARSIDALSIVDGYQAVGVIEVDVDRLGADVYIGGCLKWLCGGPGAAFLWVDPERRSSLSPRLTGWMAHATPFAFDSNFHARDDAWRFLHGTPSIPSLYAARPGLEIIREVGVSTIRAKSIRQTSRLIALAEERGWRVTAPRDPARRGGTVAIDVPRGYEVSKALKAREILCDFRPGAGVRLSPHFYTGDDELDDTITHIEAILADEEWRAYAQSHATVT